VVMTTTEPPRAVVFLGQMENEGMRTNLRAVLTDKLRAKGWELDIIDLAEARLTNCVGCFECWVKTPGSFSNGGLSHRAGFLLSPVICLVTGDSKRLSSGRPSKQIDQKSGGGGGGSSSSGYAA